MNLPNKLTVLRILLVPVFLLFFLCPQIPLHYLWAAIAFACSAITDCIDGKIARKYYMVTDFGKFLDPLADKILVMSALICLIPIGLAGPVMVVIILARDFLVTSLRLVASGKGTVIVANLWGKLKTVSQMVAICVVLVLLALGQLVAFPYVWIYLIDQILLWIATFFTILSGVIYLWQNRSFISDVI